MGRSQELYNEAKKMIPGGVQLLSKRPEMFLPGLWPAYYEKSRGCEIWDLDGNRFVDMSCMGIGSCVLGYADPDVDGKVSEAIGKGSMSTLNCPEEVELARLLCGIHPWAASVRYARTGGEAMSLAVRIARARTGKDVILFCGYHGWHDWYLSANLADEKALDGHLLPGLEPSGVPRALKGTAFPFEYNDTDSFRELVARNKGKVAAVVMEPLRSCYPEGGFLETIREVTRDEDIVMIFDEITSGWRLNAGGAHLVLGVEPDMAVFAKGMSNGYPMSAIIGRKDVMDAASGSFISSTYWTERIGPAAAIAAIGKMQKEKVSDHLRNAGKSIQEGWRKTAEKKGVKISVSGIYPLSHFSFDHEKPQVLKTLFTQLMLEKGFLASNIFYASYAHLPSHVDKYLEAAEEAFGTISKAVKGGDPERYLKGEVCHTGFKRLT